jgi:hypothetical protein
MNVYRTETGGILRPLNDELLTMVGISPESLTANRRLSRFPPLIERTQVLGESYASTAICAYDFSTPEWKDVWEFATEENQ